MHGLIPLLFGPMAPSYKYEIQVFVWHDNQVKVGMPDSIVYEVGKESLWLLSWITQGHTASLNITCAIMAQLALSRPPCSFLRQISRLSYENEEAPV
jgi:hypothetical protein